MLLEARVSSGNAERLHDGFWKDQQQDAEDDVDDGIDDEEGRIGSCRHIFKKPHQRLTLEFDVPFNFLRYDVGEVVVVHRLPLVL